MRGNAGRPADAPVDAGIPFCIPSTQEERTLRSRKRLAEIHAVDDKNCLQEARAVLVVSSDESLLYTRKLILSGAGLEVHTATDLPKALRAVLDYRPLVVVLGHTLSGSSQWSYFQTMENTAPGMCFVCLREGVPPVELLTACQTYLADQPTISRMRRLG